MGTPDLACNREAEARASRLAAARGFDAVEGFEDFFELMRRDALARGANPFAPDAPINDRQERVMGIGKAVATRRAAVSLGCGAHA